MVLGGGTWDVDLVGCDCVSMLFYFFKVVGVLPRFNADFFVLNVGIPKIKIN